MIIRADARRIPLIDGCVQTCVTSPPYWGLRDYGASAQLGVEKTPDDYVAALLSVFREVGRVLRDDGTVWLNLGDSYFGAKQLVGIPWRVAFALQADGWYLRSDIIWSKPNPMPESVTDRPTKAHEYIFLLAKSQKYYYDADAIREQNTPDMLRRAAAGHTRGGGKIDASRGDAETLRGHEQMEITANGRNKRSVWEGEVYTGQATKDYASSGAQNPSDSKRRILAAMAAPDYAGANRKTVWTVNTQPYRGSHFATFPESLVEPCVLAGAPLGGLVFDPFLGSGTVGAVAERLGRRWVGTDLSYQTLSQERTLQRGIPFTETI